MMNLEPLRSTRLPVEIVSPETSKAKHLNYLKITTHRVVLVQQSVVNFFFIRKQVSEFGQITQDHLLDRARIVAAQEQEVSAHKRHGI